MAKIIDTARDPNDEYPDQKFLALSGGSFTLDPEAAMTFPNVPGAQAYADALNRRFSEGPRTFKVVFNDHKLKTGYPPNDS